jgi:hypothetical protein
MKVMKTPSPRPSPSGLQRTGEGVSDGSFGFKESLFSPWPVLRDGRVSALDRRTVVSKGELL